MKSNVFEKVLNSVSLDERIQDGIFSLENESHMDVLREYFLNRGLDEASVIEFTNKVVEGKYPERQAYNAKGILVTFPTPEYKANAIQKGSHFEKNPTKQAPNVFAGGQQPPAPAPAQAGAPAAQPPVQPAPQPAAEQPPTTKLSKSGTPTNTPPPEAPPTTGDAPKGPSTEKPEPKADEPPPTPPKSDAEKSAEKDVIKKMLKGDDYMLEQVVSWFMNNAPEYLREQVQGHKSKYE